MDAANQKQGVMEGAASRWLEAQRGQYALWLPVFPGSGAALYFSMHAEPAVSLVLFAVVLGVCPCVLLYRVRNAGGLAALAWRAALALFLLAAGFGLAQLRTQGVAAPVLKKDIGPVRMQGNIASVEMLEEGTGLRLILENIVIGDLPPGETPRRVRIRIRDADARGLRPGQRIAVLAGLNPPSGPVAPHAFDFQFYAWFRQIGAFGFAYKAPEIVRSAPESVRWSERMRQAVTDRIDARLDGGAAAMSVAMMNGEVSAVPEKDRQAMRDSGLAHILAISGSHVGVLAGFVFFAVRFLLSLSMRAALYLPVKKIAAAAALVAATAYVIFVGPLVPVVRAWLMTDAVLIGILFDRLSISLRLLSVAATGILAFMPEALLGASFQMSFAAVAALILFYEATREWWRAAYARSGPIRKAGLYFLGLCGTSLAAEIATSPFSLFHFQQFAVYGLFANIMALPVLSFVVMPAVVMTFLALPFGLEEWPVRLLGFGDAIILRIARDVAALPGATLHLPAWPSEALALIVFAAFAAALLKGKARWIALAPGLAACAVLALFRPPDVLVSADAKLFAVRENGALSLSSRRADRFSAESWMRLAGREGEKPALWPREGEDGRGLACDAEACRFVVDRRRIAFVMRESAQREECAWADITVSARPLAGRGCKAKPAVDYFDLRREGATAIWADGRVETVQDVRGTRPWTSSNGR